MAKILLMIAIIIVLTAIVGGIMAWYDEKYEEEKEDIFEGQEWD